MSLPYALVSDLSGGTTLAHLLRAGDIMEEYTQWYPMVSVPREVRLIAPEGYTIHEEWGSGDVLPSADPRWRYFVEAPVSGTLPDGVIIAPGTNSRAVAAQVTRDRTITLMMGWSRDEAAGALAANLGITETSLAGTVAGGLYRIGAEVLYASADGTVVRGVAGTTAAAHLSGAAMARVLPRGGIVSTAIRLAARLATYETMARADAVARRRSATADEGNAPMVVVDPPMRDMLDPYVRRLPEGPVFPVDRDDMRYPNYGWRDWGTYDA